MDVDAVVEVAINFPSLLLFFYLEQMISQFMCAVVGRGKDIELSSQVAVRTTLAMRRLIHPVQRYFYGQAFPQV